MAGLRKRVVTIPRPEQFIDEASEQGVDRVDGLLWYIGQEDILADDEKYQKIVVLVEIREGKHKGELRRFDPSEIFFK